MMYARRFIVSLLSAAVFNTLQAQCVDNSVLEKKPVLINPQSSIPNNNASTIEADQFYGQLDEDWQAEGNVVIEGETMRLESQKILGDQTDGEVILPSSFRLDTRDYSVLLKSGRYFIRDDRLEGEQGEFFLRHPVQSQQSTGVVGQAASKPQLHFRGRMASIKTPASKQRHFDDVMLTTCPLAKRDWSLSADRLMINEKTQIGVVNHAVVRIGDVPVFYWPWFDFPLQGQRKSGLLIPSYTKDSNYKTNHYAISMPYYFNLAPNYDWLLTPTYINNRAWSLNNQFRYLLPNSHGMALAHYHDDSLKRTVNLLSGRYRLYWQHQQRLDDGINMSIKWNRASDIDYFKDYGDLIYPSSVINLPIEWRLSGQWQKWNWSAAYLDYQRLSQNPQRDKPYARTPLIKIDSPIWQLSGPNQIGQWKGFFSAEFSQFAHRYRPTIQRSFAYPRVQWQYHTPGYWLNAQWGLHLSNYRIRNIDDTKVNFLSHINRTVPIAKMDAGFVFERQWQGENMQRWTQTLEPKIHWLYIPYQDQSTLPLLDTSRSSFQLGQLEVENLFSGWDRIADTHQATLGLASHIYNQNQQEVLAFEIGQRWFFNEWKVLLPGESAPITKRGDLVLGLRGMTNHWRAEAKWRFNSQIDKTGSTEGVLAYQPDDYRIVGLRYMFKRKAVLPEISILDKSIIQKIDLQRTIEGVVSWPLGKGFSFTGRNYYSLHDQVYLESHMELLYSTCCMAIGLTRSNTLLDAEQHYNTSWRIEFSLFGLTQLSNRKKVIDRGFKAFKAFKVR